MHSSVATFEPGKLNLKGIPRGKEYSIDVRNLIF